MWSVHGIFDQIRDVNIILLSLNVICVITSEGILLHFFPQAEIYVNSTNGNMDLSGGAVAQALAKAAGPALQAECTKKAPIAAGEIAVTGPGKILRCKCIVHINCPGYDQSGGQAETVSHSVNTSLCTFV